MQTANFDFSKHKFRSSSMGSLMTQPRSKKDREDGVFGLSAKTFMREEWLKHVYGYEKDINTPSMQKGVLVEDESIALYSKLIKHTLFKNLEYYENEYVTGTPDIVVQDRLVIDIKSSWDVFSFMKVSKPSTMYYTQLQAYMWLTGAPEARLVYVLSNTPESLVFDEVRKKTYSVDEENYQEIEDRIRQQHTFDKIPLDQRIKKFKIERDEEYILRMQETIARARGYMSKISGL